MLRLLHIYPLHMETQTLGSFDKFVANSLYNSGKKIKAREKIENIGVYLTLGAMGLTSVEEK